MRRIPKVVGSRLLFWSLFAPTLALNLLPGSLWFDSRSVEVSDAVEGIAPIVVEDLAIHIPFLGGYDAIVYEAETSLPTTCRGAEALRYAKRLDGTSSMSLVDWVAGNQVCATLPPGTYYLNTCRTIATPVPIYGPLVTAKTVCRRSNLFIVDPKA
ncbi:MAG: hypothetical protein KDK03_01485 [Rhodobacteraceae bacterium]|nr:hypothetical protein [Paracoccaceae bacterium]